MQEILCSVLCIILFASSTASQNTTCPCSDSELCTPVNKFHEKELVAFYHLNGTDWRKFNWTRLTTIVVGDPSDELLCFSHSMNVRLVILVSVSQNDIPKLIKQEYRSMLIHLWLDNVQNKHMDGINIDIEDTVYADDFNLALINLTKEANAAFKAVHSQYQVTWDVPYSPKMLSCITGWCYDFRAIAQACDFLIVMSYDAQLDILVASANSPIHLIEEGYNQYITNLKISPEKLVMAIPWYGYDYTCKTFLNTTGLDTCIIDVSKNTEVSFKALVQKQKSDGLSVRWDDRSKSPFFTYKDEQAVYHQCWYDNVTSLTYKYKFAVSKKLHGIGMFTANGLDYGSQDPSVQATNSDMWNTITYYVSCL